MKRHCRISLLTAALTAALPLHAANPEAENAPERTAIELAAVRVQAKQSAAKDV